MTSLPMLIPQRRRVRVRQIYRSWLKWAIGLLVLAGLLLLAAHYRG